jgi:hypothetical protein
MPQQLSMELTRASNSCTSSCICATVTWRSAFSCARSSPPMQLWDQQPMQRRQVGRHRTWVTAGGRLACFLQHCWNFCCYTHVPAPRPAPASALAPPPSADCRHCRFPPVALPVVQLAVHDCQIFKCVSPAPAEGHPVVNVGVEGRPRARTPSHHQAPLFNAEIRGTRDGLLQGMAWDRDGMAFPPHPL